MTDVNSERESSAEGKAGQRSVSRKEALVLLVLFLVLAIAAGIFYSTRQGGAQVLITVNGEKYGMYPLTVDKTIPIDGADGAQNVVEIADGKVFMKSASCPNQICVHTGKIFKSGQSVVCLPNKVTVTVIGGESSSIDSMTK